MIKNLTNKRFVKLDKIDFHVETLKYYVCQILTWYLMSNKQTDKNIAPKKKKTIPKDIPIVWVNI